MDTHLESEKTQAMEAEEEKARNRRNGQSKKQIKAEFGQTEISVPRDRNSSFEPIIVPKGQNRFNGFDDKILSLYARGMTTRDIQGQLPDLYGVEVSHALISNVTSLGRNRAQRMAEPDKCAVYPILYLDALVVKVRHDGRVINKAIPDRSRSQFVRSERVTRFVDGN